MDEGKRRIPITTREIGVMLIMAVSFLLCLGITMGRSVQAGKQDTYNKARIMLKPDLEAVEELLTVQEETKEASWQTLDTAEGESGQPKLPEHEFVVFDLTGKVVLSTKDDYKEGATENLTVQLQTDHAYAAREGNLLKFCFPVEREAAVAYFIVLFVEKQELTDATGVILLKTFCPLMLWGMFAFGVLVLYNVWFQKSWKRPMEEMVLSSRAIMKGDYSRQITQKRLQDRPDNQISQLVYSFECMRDELRHKVKREEELCSAQKELMSCMSHDLRTPITTIRAHAEAIRDGIIKDEDKKLEYINTIVRKSEVMARMISDLLDHSNAQANRMEITCKEQYLSSFLQEIAKELSTYCQTNGCQFQFENQCGEVLVTMDRGRITQVIYNLVENSCKYRDYHREDGMICLTCTKNEEERRVYFSVSDNGMGIAITDIPYVFDRFYRAEKSRSTQIPGAGLGLNICKYIVEQHHGEIALQSRKNEGTKVTFYLPY